MKLQIQISLIFTIAVSYSCKQTVNIGDAKIDYKTAFRSLEDLEDRTREIRCTSNCISLAAASRWRLEPYTVATVDFTKKKINILHFPIKQVVKSFALAENELLEFQEYMALTSDAYNIYHGARDMNDGSIFFGRICWRFTCVRFGIYGELNYKKDMTYSDDLKIDRSLKSILNLTAHILKIGALKWPYAGEDNSPAAR